MKLEYIDYRKMRFLLKAGQKSLPSGNNIIDVDEKEGKRLLKFKNGNKPIFKKVVSRKIENEIKEL